MGNNITVSEEHWLRLAELGETNKDKLNQVINHVDQLEKNLEKNQPIIDGFAMNGNKRYGPQQSNTIESQIVGQLSERKAEIDNFIHSKNEVLKMQIKTAGVLLTSDHLSGNPQQSYNTSFGIVPPQNRNMRDFLPTIQAPTGSLVSFRETNTVQTMTTQTEGSSKQAMDYSITQVTSTSKYIAGQTRFSKQYMYALPQLQSILTNMLLRDFYKKENDYLYTTIASNSTGTSTTTGLTTDAEELLQVILNQRSRNFEASVAFIDLTELGRILFTKPSNYSIPYGYSITADGQITCLGCPIVATTYAQTDHALVIDRNYYQRQETESLNVTFSYEDQDNFVKNLVTVRCEAFEELNRLRDDASCYHDMGNS